MTGRTRLTIVAAVASMLAMLTLAPVVDDHAWTVPAALGIALVAATGLGLRRLRLPLLLVLAGQLGVLVLWLGVVVAGDVAWFGVVPTLAWAERLVMAFTDGLDAVAQYAAPAPVTRGILLLLVGGTGLVAVVVDLFAVGVRRVPLTGIALGAVYALAASVAPGGLSWIWFLPPAIGFLGLLVAEGRTRVVRWGRSAGPSATHSGIPETDSLARNGRRVGAVAIAAAVALPALLPGLTEGIFGRGGGPGEGAGRTIQTDNPIVELQGNLTLPENVPILRYSTDADPPVYIRLATLDVFDGEQWSVSNRNVPDTQRVGGGMPPPPGLSLSGEEEVEEYEIEVSDEYDSRWLPLPYPARRIAIDGDWRYDVASLDVVGGERDAGGATYTVDRIAVDLDATELITAGVPPEEVQNMLELPDDLPDMVRELAGQVTEDASSAHGRAAALQDFFRRTGSFEYTLETEPGTSSSDLVNFLENRRGYCEQYAAAMAIMSRAVGIPARVAVGYTPGTIQDDGSFVVGTDDSHAWPELYFQGTGWVPWEPTPATRTGSAPTWTVTPTEDGTDGANSSQIPTGEGAQEGALPPGALDPEVGAGDAGGGSTPASTWIAVAIAAAAAAGVFAVPTMIARGRRRLRWRRAGTDPVHGAEAAWSDLRDTVRDAGLEWDEAATPRTTGRNVANAAHLDDDSRDLVTHLVTTTERARYSATPADPTGLRGDSAMLRRTIMRSRSVAQRFGAAIWPAATRDLVVSAANRVADGLDWTDAAGERMRHRAGRLLPGRR
ncbi:MAG: transglutaminaseTgpA domain-containing protein [Jiangellaceae bacterium]